jgi:TPR repeat protein
MAKKQKSNGENRSNHLLEMMLDLPSLKNIIRNDPQNADALLCLGLHYLLGYYVPQDIKKSFELLEQAAELGQPDAVYTIGYAYKEGIDGYIEQDPVAASTFLSIAEKRHKK